MFFIYLLYLLNGCQKIICSPLLEINILFLIGNLHSISKKKCCIHDYRILNYSSFFFFLIRRKLRSGRNLVGVMLKVYKFEEKRDSELKFF